ncbi:ecto-NOX disulfide-thiol exchanger 1 [Trichonephila clavata]|uniref:Ecto-NOX disulfide-thiol exchanger 1 n=1 Tax=Trichonephila clavata TaxID=2740835 RepID=A0A8X6IJT0_TRICU|nr:ecto-NOX disulfide-thiol exchanger 1 [Trichonephila clavata]
MEKGMYDFERRDRQRVREERHRAKKPRSHSPSPIYCFSKQETIRVNDKLRNKETFKEGARILFTWLDRGECSKQNHGAFYSMLESTSIYAKRLAKEKSRWEEEVEKARENLDMVARYMQLDLSEIEKVYAAAELKKNWDHFSKGQRKQIDDWKKEIASFSTALITVRLEEGMDLDMDENAEECSNEDQTENDELYQLRESNDFLKQQLTSIQKELDCSNLLCNQYYKDILKLKSVSGVSQKVGSSEIPVENGYHSDYAIKNVSVTNSSTQCVPDKIDVTENGTSLVSLISVFLHVHPFGANIDYICSYLLETHPAITTKDIESLLRKFPNIFEDMSTGIGATLQKKWKCVAFGSSTLPTSHYSDNSRKDVSVANNSTQCVPDKIDVTENEICLVSLISVFLHVHPFGANIDYICAYLLETHPAITTRDIESLLRKFPNIFEDMSTGIGATLQKKWKCVAFGSSTLPTSHYSDNSRKDVSVANNSTQCVPDKIDVTENEICLASLISVFLHVHPFGANIDYICAYMLETHPAVTTRDIESLLRKFPNIFIEISTGTGATLQKKWKYVAFSSLTLPTSYCYSDNARKDASVPNSSTLCVPDIIDGTENETCLVNLISVFLHVHPFGANIDYICSYMLETHPAVKTTGIESLLTKFPDIFGDIYTGIGATLQKKWKYVAFGSSALPNSH